MRRERWHRTRRVPAPSREVFLPGARHRPPASLGAAEPQPEAQMDPEPRQQTRERSPLLRPSKLEQSRCCVNREKV